MRLFKSVRKGTIVSILLIFITSCVMAQVGGEDTPPGDPDDPTVPISGIEILLAVGGALGIKRIVQRRKES
jgi:hypothetical protein